MQMRETAIERLEFDIRALFVHTLLFGRLSLPRGGGGEGLIHEDGLELKPSR